MAQIAPRFSRPVRELFSDVGGEMFIPSAGGKVVVRKTIERLSSEVIVNSKAVQQSVLGFTPIRNSSIVYNAVSSEYFHLQKTPEDFRHEIGIGPESKVVGIPSTMRPMKGQLFFLAALRRIVDLDSTVIAVFLGDIKSAYGEKVVEMVRELRLDDHVCFAGEIKNMPTFYGMCDVICVPSVAEPFGRVAIEAFFSGTPVVATNVGGLPEIVEDQVTGLLVEYGDVEGFANAVLKMISNPTLAARLSGTAEILACSKFSEAAYKNNVLNVVGSALGN